MGEFGLAIFSAIWLGILTSLSPCPLATNLAAISFVGRKVGSVRSVLAAGLLYTLGRMAAYIAVGVLLVGGLLAAPEFSHLLQKYLNLLMGPLLILVAMVLLDMLSLPSWGGGAGAALQRRAERLGVCGAPLLGFLFALSFCPTSAALFFGSLLPLAVKYESRVILPGSFGVATGLPVLLSAFLLAFSANRIAAAYHKLAGFEAWAQRLTGLVFLLVGLYMTITITLGIQLW